MMMFGEPGHTSKSLTSDAIRALIGVGWVVVGMEQVHPPRQLKPRDYDYYEYTVKMVWGRSVDEQRYKFLELTVRVDTEVEK